MPRPSIKAKKTKPQGLPKPRAAPKKKKNAALAAAQKAVAEFETQLRLLHEMREDWDENFPEARLALKDLRHQEDTVAETVKRAKPLVAQAKEDVGDFIAKRKYSKPHYDPEEVTKVLTELDGGLDIFGEMLDDGIVKVVDLDRDAALAWFAQRPSYSEEFQSAFREAVEMTTAVTVPKI